MDEGMVECRRQAHEESSP